MKTIIGLALGILLAMPIVSYCQDIEYVGSTLWCSVHDVKVSGNYAYCAFLNGLVILDISNPTTPLFVSQFYTHGYAYGVYISGNYAYIADCNMGLKIVDVSNPLSPSLVGGYLVRGYSQANVSVSGNYAYLANGYLLIIDISDPANPVLADTCDTPGRALDIYISGNYAYIADQYRGLQIVDISDPIAPRVVGPGYEAPGWARGICISGDYAYVAYDGSGLHIVNISNPINPVFIGNYDTNESSFDVTVAGNYAYVADWLGGLKIIDITDPVNPVLAGMYDTLGYARGIFVANNYAYLANGISDSRFHRAPGLAVIDISNSTNPTLAGTYDTPEYENSVYVLANYAYIAATSAGIYIVDISDSARPMPVSNYDTPGRAMGVFIRDNYAYVADDSSGLQIVDVSNPADPILLGGYDTPDEALDVFVSGSYAYVADQISGLQIINITDPTNPTLTGNLNTPGWANRVYVAGINAYVSDRWGGLQVINISNPARPTLSWSFDPYYEYDAYDAAVIGDYVYMAAWGPYGLRTLYIPDRVSSGFCALNESPYDVFVSGNYAYIANESHGVKVINVTNPLYPSLVGSYGTPYNSNGVFVVNNYIYLADGTCFAILRFPATAIEERNPIPDKFTLFPNYPNPFNSSTMISYFICKSAPVDLSIYNLLGQRVAILNNGFQKAGKYEYTWDAHDHASGIYFAKLESDGQETTTKMILLK